MEPLQEVKKSALQADCLTYPLGLVFLGFWLFWRRSGNFNFWFPFFLTGLILLKGTLLIYPSFKLLRTYPTIPSGEGRQSGPEQVRDLPLGKILVFLFSLNFGGYILLLPITRAASPLFRSPVEFFFKTFFISILTLGIFLLGLSLSRSPASSFLAWLMVTFNFPFIQIPTRLTPLLLGSGIIWGLYLLYRLPDLKNLRVWDRLNRLDVESGAIVFALTLVLLGLAFKSFIPNPVFHPTPFLKGFFGFLLDRQLGIFSYAPLYLLALLGLGALLREGLSKKFLILILGLFMYGMVCLIRYGFPAKPSSPELNKPFNPEDIIPLLPVLGSLFAVFLKQARGGEWERGGRGSRLPAPSPSSPRAPVLLLTLWLSLSLFLLNVGTVGSVLLGDPTVPSLVGKFKNFQTHLAESLGRELFFFYPSLASGFSWISWGVWIPVLGGLTFLGYQMAGPHNFAPLPPQPTSGPRTPSRAMKGPAFAIFFLLVAALLFELAPRYYVVPIKPPLYLSLKKPTWEMDLEGAPVPLSKSCILVSSLANSIGFPQEQVAAILTLEEDSGEVRSFSILSGEHTSEWAFENPEVQPYLAHNQAMIYSSEMTRIRNGPWFEAHTYYVQFDFEKPLKIHKINLRLVSPPGFKLLDSVLRIEKLVLLY